MFNNMLKTRPLNDGTKGFRFDCLGVKGIYRKRIATKRPFEFALHKGKTFAQCHIGKRSVYIEQMNPSKALYDFALREKAVTLAKYAAQIGA